jgi:cytoplasmic iron level regulating protein YaaA (DUF328/UPF0246 family)
MERVVLLSCVSKKLARKARAQDLYTSTLFKFNLAYAKTLKPRDIFILSAKYGLIALNDEIEPYDQTLNAMPEREKKAWADRVAQQLRTHINMRDDEVVFLAGENYRKYLLAHLSHVTVPMRGLGIGKQLQFLKGKLHG